MAPGDKTHFPQPDAPKYSTSPLQSLESNPFLPPSVFAKYGYAALGAFTGGATIAGHNYYNRRPIVSGIQRYPIAILVGAAVVYQYQKYKESQWAERDAIFRHYISLHPEDFPPYQRVKLGDVFDDWYPIR